jgi:hypothetical protein
MTLAGDCQEIGKDLAGESMGTPAQIGGNEWKAVITEARFVKAEIRTLVRKALESHDLNYLTQAAFKLGDLDDVLNRLDQIGNNTKEKKCLD